MVLSHYLGMKTGINNPSSFRLYRIVPLCLAVLMCSFTSSVQAADSQVKEVLSFARSYLGDEASLNAVESLRFAGEFSYGEGQVGKIEILMEKPCHQLQVMHTGESVIEVGLDDIEAWKKTYREGSPDKFRLLMAQLVELKRLRANCFENLNFYSTKRIPGRRIDYLGKVEVDGIEAHQVRFSYGSVSFTRHFDVETGQLVMTRLENGEEIREDGEIEVAGIRFPKKLITRSADGDINIITFKTIEVNPEIDDTIFEVPSLTGN